MQNQMIWLVLFPSPVLYYYFFLQKQKKKNHVSAPKMELPRTYRSSSDSQTAWIWCEMIKFMLSSSLSVHQPEEAQSKQPSRGRSNDHFSDTVFEKQQLL